MSNNAIKNNNKEIREIRRHANIEEKKKQQANIIKRSEKNRAFGYSKCDVKLF